MMKFEIPEMTISWFDAEDIITVSGEPDAMTLANIKAQESLQENEEFKAVLKLTF